MLDISITHEFEELHIDVLGSYSTGIMICGTAYLEGDEDGFSVQKICLGTGRAIGGTTWLRRTGNSVLSQPDPFADELFKRIESCLLNAKSAPGKTAADAWRWAVSEAREGLEPSQPYSTMNVAQQGLKASPARV